MIALAVCRLWRNSGRPELTQQRQALSSVSPAISRRCEMIALAVCRLWRNSGRPELIQQPLAAAAPALLSAGGAR